MVIPKQAFKTLFDIAEDRLARAGSAVVSPEIRALMGDMERRILAGLPVAESEYQAVSYAFWEWADFGILSRRALPDELQAMTHRGRCNCLPSGERQPLPGSHCRRREIRKSGTFCNMGRRKKLVEIARLEGNPGRRPLDLSGVEGLGSPSSQNICRTTPVAASTSSSSRCRRMSIPRSTALSCPHLRRHGPSTSARPMKWVALDSCGPAKRSAAPKVKMFGSKLRASKRHNLRPWGIAWD